MKAFEKLDSFGESKASLSTSYTVGFNMSGHGTQITAQTVEDGNKATKPAESGYNRP